MSSNTSSCPRVLMAFFPSNFMLSSTPTNDHEFSTHPPHPPLSPQDFHGIAPMLGKRSMPYSTIDMWEETNGNHHHNNNNNNNEDEMLSEDEGGSQLGGGGGRGEKKRRLNIEQVKTLEKNFELGNKLEPERKLQLAKALGLQPRQIAIWFQNRRARWKTKQLEKDYDLLKRQFDSLKADNDALLAHNHKLQAQITSLKNREPTESINLNKDTEGSCSNRSDNSSDQEIKLDISRTTTTTESPLGRLTSHQATTTTATGRDLFPPLTTGRLNGPPVAQLLFQGQVQQTSVKEETLTNMFCGIDDQNGFWPWIEQPNFN